MSSRAATNPERFWDKKLLDSVWAEQMFLCYKMLLLINMLDHVDAEGSVAIRDLASAFSDFFAERNRNGKTEENPKAFTTGWPPSSRSISEWEQVLKNEPLSRMHLEVIGFDDTRAWFVPDSWRKWSLAFKRALRNTAEVRLIEYFENRVPDGY